MATETVNENELAIWLKEQIGACARGELSTRQVEYLTDQAQGWLLAYTARGSDEAAILVAAAREHYPEAVIERAATPTR